MKHLKIAVIALFALVTVSSANAQDSNNPWAFSLGVNTVDFYNSTSFGDNVKDLLGNNDWNVIPALSVFSASKYLDNGFSVQLMGSFNKIKTLVSKDDSDFIYYSLDANVKYDLNKLVEMAFGSGTQYFDPFVFLGGGYVAGDDRTATTLNVGVGFNTWFNENLGLTFQTGTKKNTSGSFKSHYQSSLGLTLRLGGKDTDGDGVYDKDDKCPNEPGLAAFDGCPDTDGDGIQDSQDACPTVAGLAALNGCPDADGDGIADKDDMCPNEKGSAANRGCPDSDNDGVVDKDDNCPNVAGPAANNGCPWPDTDGDGVLDKDDKCPNEAGVASNDGCPEPVITDEAARTLDTYAKSILFNTGKYSFKPGVTDQLDNIVEVMNQYPEAKFTISGHTDSTGGAALNLRISEKRAIAVRDYLVKNGVSAERLDAKGFGEGSPIDDNKTVKGRANNRRVEIKVNNM